MGARDSLLWLEEEIVKDIEPPWYLVVFGASGNESHNEVNELQAHNLGTFFNLGVWTAKGTCMSCAYTRQLMQNACEVPLRYLTENLHVGCRCS